MFLWYPGHVAAAWLGHGTLVAQKNYRQVTDADFEKCKHKAAVTDSKEEEVEIESSSIPADHATLPQCTGVKVGDTRLEQHPQSPGKTEVRREVQAQVQVNSPITDPGLAILVEAWSNLDEETKSSILAMIENE
ncbi:hypothetical protein [Bythopirellula goksoeyrii]|uniref:Uncharacterized protein n=1 Tax=Bythopirellula goksoeyrii TaxID=1400387 RepID=A0A5B9Q5S8_9BACT|nr:hypothetical protein [Bythopirellula goksoeyrii]QEG34414.1 hypothetical protein Pr1d_16930 [Bythopirellula goksoeyrii]